MKRSVRPLFSICLLTVIAATLTFRIILRPGPTFSSLDADEAPKPAAPVFNATLLRYAAVDLGEVKMKQEIEDLVEGNFRGQGRQRSFLSSGKYRIDVRARSARGMPVQLRSPEFYRLWLEFRRHLQDWSRNRRFQPDIMSDLMSTVKGLVDKNNGVFGLGKKYKTCAVVGNSGILLKSALGGVIDSHEFVIRLNNARTTSFEIDVGKKTSVSFVS